MKPYFSIIIATFNSGAVLGAALTSIANQTDRSFEVIIIDNESTDSTLIVAKFFQKLMPFMRIVSEKDNGTYDAINKGVLLARGSWIYNLGSDDTLFSCSILTDVRNQLENTHRNFAYGSIRAIGKGKSLKSGQIYDGEFSKDKIYTRGISQQATFYRKEIFKQLGLFNTKYKIWADWEFALRAFKEDEEFYLSLVIADFSLGGISSRQKDIDFIHDQVNKK